MPTYDLQYGAGSSKSPSGQLQVSGTSAATATFQVRPNANATWQTITGPVYTAVAAGGGTPATPVAGDTLSMGTGAVNGHSFQGSGTFSTSRTPNGYYAGASITGGAGDWDAVDGGGGKP